MSAPRIDFVLITFALDGQVASEVRPEEGWTFGAALQVGDRVDSPRGTFRVQRRAWLMHERFETQLRVYLEPWT